MPRTHPPYAAEYRRRIVELARGYARSLEPLPAAVTVRGISKSAVSERFVYGTDRKLTRTDEPRSA